MRYDDISSSHISEIVSYFTVTAAAKMTILKLLLLAFNFAGILAEYTITEDTDDPDKFYIDVSMPIEQKIVDNLYLCTAIPLPNEGTLVQCCLLDMCFEAA